MSASCLEIRAVEKRRDLMAKNGYSAGDGTEYSAKHPNALATGDAKGRGTGHEYGDMWLPNHCGSQINMFNYSNFITDPTEHLIGTSVDTNARREALNHSLYNQAHPYTDTLYDMEPNSFDGIYNIG